ncbi:MAG: hypothetical protein IJE60_00100 [Tyzzerella sp.]|nr:hypothetical protein [Tyzzerella sp.]
MSYTLYIAKQYRDEIISVFQQVLQLLEQLFMLVGEKALTHNEFSIKNEAVEYFSKLSFYGNKIESLEKRKSIVEEKCKNKYDVTKTDQGYTCITPKAQDYLRSLRNEMTYDIEAYIDTFFSSTFKKYSSLAYAFLRCYNLRKAYFLLHGILLCILEGNVPII